MRSRGSGRRGPRRRGPARPSLPFREDIWFDDVDPADIEAAVGPAAAAVARRRLGCRERSAALVKERAFGGCAAGPARAGAGLLRAPGPCQCPCVSIELVTLRSAGDGRGAGADPGAPRRCLPEPLAPLSLTRALALDCEMVGVGPAGEDSAAARVSIVNQFGKCVYDKYVKPTQPVTDYRTAVSGIRPENLKQGGPTPPGGRGGRSGRGPVPPWRFPVPKRGPQQVLAGSPPLGPWLPGGSHARHGFALVPLSHMTQGPGHWP